MVGTFVGPYHVLEKLGEGGMGEVYRARDTKLQRDVALKVLLPEVAGDSSRVARFAREAQTLAALNHSNIATVYGVEEHADAGPCIVMELVPGQDLAGLLREGPQPIADVLAIGRQIADGLEAAHEAGLVHRDLKPANVRVRDDGVVKILDFGLAKAVEPQAATRRSGTDLANSPTMAPAARTEAGLIVGTVAYMSPEQAKARFVDKRADIWAFGVILYEMLAGRHPFHAETMSEVLAAVLTRPVDVSDLPATTPPRLRGLVQRCLARDQRQRLRDIGDARQVIEEMLAGTPDAERPALPARRVSAWQRAAPWAVAAVAIIAAMAVAWPNRGSSTGEPRVVAWSATPLPTFALFVALSRDGRNLAFSTIDGTKGYHIALRPLDRLDARPIAGTADGRFPIFSPDGQHIAFFVPERGGTIRRVSIAGSEVIDICADTFPNGAAWGDDNTIVFSGNSGQLMRVSANGGKPESLTTIASDPEIAAHTRPQFLPQNRILFTVRKKNGSSEFAVLENGATRIVGPGGDNGRFVASGPDGVTGHLLYARDETVFAVPFDVDRLAIVGPEAPVLERVSRNGPRWTSDYTVSENGLLVFSQAFRNEDVALSWIDRSGRVSPLDIGPQLFGPRLSPDGARAVGLQVDDTGRSDVAVLDLGRGTATRLTSSGSSRSPIWTPDGDHIVYGATIDQTSAIYTIRSDGGAAPRQQFTTPAGADPMTMTPDGKTLVYNQRSRLFVRPLDGAGEARPLHAAPQGPEMEARLSPDGRWIAYTSLESGRGEVYVHEFPGPGRRERVSTNGGEVVRWGEGGRSIFYWDMTGQTGNSNVMRVQVRTAPALQLETPTALFAKTSTALTDVTSDGSRFLGWSARTGQPTTLVLVTNWFDELRAKAPAASR